MKRALLAVGLLGCVAKSEVAVTDGAMVMEATDRHDWIDVQRRSVQAGDVRLSVLDRGGDGAPVVMLHGLGSTASFFEHQFADAHLAGLRLIAPDLPGWGRSDQPDAAYTPSFYADTVVAMLDAMGLSKVTLVGHSMGGQAAIALALAHPERVERLVLSAPAGIETFTEEQAAILGSFWTVEKLRERPEAELRAAFDLVFARKDDGVERLVQERLAVDGTERFPGLARAVIRSVQGMLDEPVRERLGEVSVPTLVVMGEADAMIPNRFMNPGLTPQSVGRTAADAMEGHFVMLEGAGHTPHHDDPAGFAVALLAFLQATPSQEN